jgi:hypothetical protein
LFVHSVHVFLLLLAKEERRIDRVGSPACPPAPLAELLLRQQLSLIIVIAHGCSKGCSVSFSVFEANGIVGAARAANGRTDRRQAAEGGPQFSDTR